MSDQGEIFVLAKPDSVECLDAVAVRQLVASCVRGALRGLGRLPATEDVDDLVQEALLVLWHRTASDRPAKRAYVARIVWSVTVDRLRHASAKKRGAGRIAALAAADEVREVSRSAEERLIDEERLHALVSTIRSAMPARMRTALKLRCIEGLTASEAARVLGMSPSGVDTALHRARSRLRRRLEKQADQAHDGDASP